MTLDLNALWLLLVSGILVGSLKMLMNRLQDIERVLDSHGRKLVRIETKLGVPDDIA